MHTEEDQENSSLLESVDSEDLAEQNVIPPLNKAKLSTFEIILRIIFPPILLWDLLKYTMHLLFGNFIGTLVLQSRAYNQEKSAKDFESQLLKFANSQLCFEVEHQRKLISTQDDAKIDTISFTKNNTEISKHTGIYIIHCNGSADNYESQMINYALEAFELNCTVIGFNYRGIGQSSVDATAFRDLVNDAIAVTQDLLDQGVDPENIVLEGFSLGGVVASYVNKQLRSISDDPDKSLYIYADRSPSNFTKFIIGFIRRTGQFLSAYFNKKLEGSIIENIDGYTENPFWKFMGAISYPFIKFALVATEWDAEAATVFQETPFNHRAHTVVKSSAEIRSNFHPADDHVTSDYASMHRALKSERKALKSMDTTDEQSKKAHTILRKASRLSAHSTGHWQAPENMTSKNFGEDENIRINGRQHFHCFVRATHPGAYSDDRLKKEERILQDAWNTVGFGATS